MVEQQTLLSHLPVLAIILPLIGAPLCMLLGRGILSWGFATIVSALSFLVSCGLLMAAMEQGVISYAVGGWEPPWGMEMMSDEARLELGFM